MSCWYCTSQSCGESWGRRQDLERGACAPTSPLLGPIYPACSSVSFTPAHHVPWGASAHLVQVGKDEQAQLFAHVHGVHGEVILELGDGNEAVNLGRQSSNLKPWPRGPCLHPPPQLPPAQPTHVLIHQLLALCSEAAPIGHGHVGYRISQEGSLGRGGGCRVAQATGHPLGPIAPALG